MELGKGLGHESHEGAQGVQPEEAHREPYHSLQYNLTGGCSRAGVSLSSPGTSNRTRGQSLNLCQKFTLDIRTNSVTGVPKDCNGLPRAVVE